MLIKRQNLVCSMEWQRFCTTTCFYEIDAKTPPQEIERAQRNLADYQDRRKHNEGK